jgi:hypothetical protein
MKFLILEEQIKMVTHLEIVILSYNFVYRKLTIFVVAALLIKPKQHYGKNTGLPTSENATTFLKNASFEKNSPKNDEK